MTYFETNPLCSPQTDSQSRDRFFQTSACPQRPSHNRTMRPASGSSHNQQQQQTRNPMSKRKQTQPMHLPKVNHEIHALQQSTHTLISRAPFCRVVREILMALGNPVAEHMRVQSTALQALQEAAEMYLTQLMEDAYRCTLHRDRVTLMPKDMRLARYLRGASDPGNL